MGLRKVPRVSDELVNVAYVAKDGITPDMVRLTSETGRVRESRRIAYADPAGCLIDAITGKSTFPDPFPYITNRFYDVDLDAQVDFDELVAERALPYYYASTRTYYGPADYEAYSEFAYTAGGSGVYSPLDAARFARYPAPADRISLVDSAGNPYEGKYTILVERVARDAVVSKGTNDYDYDTHAGHAAYKIHLLLDRTDTELFLVFPAGDVEAVRELAALTSDDFNRADGALGTNWTIYGTDPWTISGNTAITTGTGSTYAAYHNGSQFSDGKVTVKLPWSGTSTDSNYSVFVRRKDWSNYYFLEYVQSSKTLRIRKKIATTSTTLVSMVLTDHPGEISLEVIGSALYAYADGAKKLQTSNTEISGSYCAGVRAINNDGNAAHTTALDDFTAEAYVIADYIPVEIDPTHREEVRATGLFAYKALTDVVTPTAAGKQLAASVPAKDGYRYYVPDKAIIDNREFDFFFWRVVGRFSRTTDLAAITDDRVAVAVIGPLSDSLAKFLDGDSMYNYKFRCFNPVTRSSRTRWSADTTAMREGRYDLIIVTGRTVDWPSKITLLMQAAAKGTTVWFNLGGAVASTITSVLETRHASFLPKFALGPVTTYTALSANVRGNHTDLFDPLSAKMNASAVTDLESCFDISNELNDLKVARVANTNPVQFKAQPVYRCAYFNGNGTTKVFSFPVRGAASIACVGHSADYKFNTVTAADQYSVTVADGVATVTFVTAPTNAHHYRIDFKVTCAGNPDVALYSGTDALMMATSNNFWASGLGLDVVSRFGVKELTANMIANASRGGEKIAGGKALANYEVASPWRLSWVAGIAEDGRPLLTDNELGRYDFYVDVDTSGSDEVVQPKRILSQASAKQIVLRSERGSDILPTDNVRYSLEVSGHDPQFVHYNTAISGGERPVVWSDRIAERNVFPSGWRLDEFEDSESRATPAVPQHTLAGTAQVALEILDDDPIDAAVSFGVTAKFSVKTTTTKDHILRSNDDYVAKVTTQSDIDWFCRANADPTSLANLHGWSPIDAIKWYPYDGNDFLADLDGNTHSGDPIVYIQALLNEIHAHGGDSHSGARNPYLPLHVDGHYDSTTEAAFRWYQTNWDIRCDGDVDAGTLAHMLRNARRVGVDWNSYLKHWNAWGPVENVIDGKWETAHGRRTWVNTKTQRMDDAIIIFLNQGLKVKKLTLVPFAQHWSSSPAGADTLLVWRYGGSRRGVCSWDFNNYSYPRHLTHDTGYTFDLTDRSLDTLYVNVSQNRSFRNDGKPCKMWGFRTVDWTVEVTATTTTYSTSSYKFAQTLMAFETGQIRNIVWNPIPAPMRKWFVGYDKTANQIRDAIIASLPADLRSSFTVTVTVSTDGTITAAILKISSSFTSSELTGATWSFSIPQEQELVYAPADPLYWPGLYTAALLNDESWDGTFVIHLTGGDMGVTPIFYDTLTGERFTKLDYNEVRLRGIHRIRLAVLSGNVEWADRTASSPTRFPKRYAMKPFCIVTKAADAALPVLGVDGDGPTESWGLKVKTGLFSRSLTIPWAPLEKTLPFINGQLGLLAGRKADCLYVVAGESYSTTHGMPYIDVTGETATVVDVNAIQLANAPVLPGITLTTTKASSGVTDTLTVIDVDAATGRARFRSALGLDYLANDTVTANYTYREEYVSYRGTAADVFDCCPADGHYMNLDGVKYATADLVGKEIHIYLLPASVTINGQTMTNARTIYHTAKEITNPLAVKLATVVINTATTENAVTLIDTRIGGGGVADHHIAAAKRAVPESEGFWDIGYLDGDAYLRGGTVIMKLPVSWRDAWVARGVDPDAMVAKLAERYLPAGKTHLVSWE